MPVTRAFRLAPLPLLLLALGCGSDSAGPYGGGCTPTATRVCMRNTAYNPATLTVSAGTQVTWQNGDGVEHTATSNPGNPGGCPTWDLSVGAGGSRTAAMTGTGPLTCQYYCRFHATPTAGVMRGTIMIQ